MYVSGFAFSGVFDTAVSAMGGNEVNAISSFGIGAISGFDDPVLIVFGED